MTYSFLCPLEQMCEVSAFVADVLNSVLLPSGTYSPGKTSPQVLHFIISIGILVIHLLVLHILFYILSYIRCCFYICLPCQCVSNLKINDVEPKKTRLWSLSRYVIILIFMRMTNMVFQFCFVTSCQSTHFTGRLFWVEWYKFFVSQTFIVSFIFSFTIWQFFCPDYWDII